jgi:hypothetical protein
MDLPDFVVVELAAVLDSGDRDKSLLPVFVVQAIDTAKFTGVVGDKRESLV